jgi:hypothetical protein
MKHIILFENYFVNESMGQKLKSGATFYANYK